MVDYPSSRRALRSGIAVLAMVGLTTAAVAQDTGDTKGQAAKKAAGTAAGAAGSKTTDPNAGGVAGTGLGGGTLLKNGLGKDMSGTGMSVSGKAGAGLGLDAGGAATTSGADANGAKPDK